MKTFLKYSHIFVSVIVVMIAHLIGVDELTAALIISAYWIGRELAQAEERFIQLHTPNKRRSEMPILTAYYNPKAWNKKGFFQDMLIPFILSLSLALYLQHTGGISTWL